MHELCNLGRALIRYARGATQLRPLRETKNLSVIATGSASLTLAGTAVPADCAYGDTFYPDNGGDSGLG